MAAPVRCQGEERNFTAVGMFLSRVFAKTLSWELWGLGEKLDVGVAL